MRRGRAVVRGGDGRASWVTLLTATLLLSYVFVATPPPAQAALAQKLAIPAYFYPAGDGLTYWDQIRSGAPTVDLVVATGLSLEGESPDANYQAQIAATRAAGITVLAYVATTYGARPVGTLTAEIDKAYAWYGVDGIFFDEAVAYPVTCDQYGYYRALHDHVKSKSGPAVTVINHGQILPECYASAADVMLSIEADYATYVNDWEAWGWEQSYPPGKFWHLIHGVHTVDDMRETIALSKSRNAGRVFVTPSNGYNSLPPNPYWTAQLSAASGAGSVTIVSQGTVEPGEPFTVSGSGAIPNTSYVLKMGASPAACLTGQSLGGNVVAGPDGTIAPRQRTIPTSATSGRHYLCLVRIGDAANSLAATAVTIV